MHKTKKVSQAGATPIRVLLQTFLVLLAFILLYVAWNQVGGVLTFSNIQARWYSILHWMENHPVALVFAMGVIPAFGIPISTFYILCGGVYGIGRGLALCSVGLALNLAFAYFLGRHVLQTFLIEPLRKRYGFSELRVRTRKAALQWVVMVRLIPALPVCAQSYILCSIKGIKFIYYWVPSWVVQMGWACVFSIGGKDWVHGHIGVMGIVCVLIFSFVARWAYKQAKTLKGDVKQM